MHFVPLSKVKIGTLYTTDMNDNLVFFSETFCFQATSNKAKKRRLTDCNLQLCPNVYRLIWGIDSQQCQLKPSVTVYSHRDHLPLQRQIYLMFMISVGMYCIHSCLTTLFFFLFCVIGRPYIYVINSYIFA